MNDWGTSPQNARVLERLEVEANLDMVDIVGLAADLLAIGMILKPKKCA